MARLAEQTSSDNTCSCCTQQVPQESWTGWSMSDLLPSQCLGLEDVTQPISDELHSYPSVNGNM